MEEPRPPNLRGLPPVGWKGRYILIGASTGGVDVLQRVLACFPEECPPTVIVQHMPDSFLASFAQRLDQSSRPRVRLATDGAVLRPGRVLLAPGGARHLWIEGRTTLTCRLQPGERHNGHCPSIDVTFASAVPTAGAAVAALLTGMGRDGAAGLRALRDAGARTLAQDRETSVVWGMPRAAWENGGAQELVAMDRIGPRLIELCARGPRTGGAA